MILEIRLENFFSIREEVSIDFRAAPTKTTLAQSLSRNVAEWEGEKILKSVGLFGSNAAGKSNIIKAIQFCCQMVLSSHLHNEGAIFNFSPFKFGDAATKPSRFFIDFVHEGVEYEYGFALTRTEILQESLHHYPKGRKAKVFVRDETIAGGKAEKYSFGDGIARPMDVAESTSRKTLFLTSASQKDRELAKSLYRFFNERFLLGFVHLNEASVEEQFTANKDLILRALKVCDSNIVDIRSVHEKVESKSFQFDLASGVSSVTPGPVDVIRFETFHQHAPTVPFDMELEESLGTRRMFLAMLRLIAVVREGKAIMLDEFDASLHTKIAEFILDLVHASSGAQLLYTTHNTNLIDMKRSRRDQVVFVNKNAEGATEVYSLFDYKDFRENMDAEKGYLQGRFDAIPLVDASPDSLKRMILGET